MKIYFANQDPIFELNDHHKDVFCSHLNRDELEKDIARRCKYWLELPAHKYAWINRKLFREELKKAGVRSIPADHVKAAKQSISVNYQPQELQCKVGDTPFTFSADHMLVNMRAKEALKRDLMKHWDKTEGVLADRVQQLKNGLHGYQGQLETAERWVEGLPNPERDFPDAAIVAINEADDLVRMISILKHKYERCLERLRMQWEPILDSRVGGIPLDDIEFMDLVKSQPDYKDRKQSDLEGANGIT